jgi:cytochrome c biogenesis protein CcdA/glutaredoxin
VGSKGLRGIAIAVLATVVLLLWAGAAAAVSPHPVGRVGSTPPADEVTLVLYHGEGCPHCAAEREWLVGLQDRNPGLSVEQYEVWGDETNRARLAEHAAELGFEPSGVPVTVVGQRYWVGFNAAVADDVEATVAALLAGENAPAPTSGQLELPVVGQVDPGSSSLLVSTLAIGFVDGVNPCSLWALSVLLAIVLHSGSRGRVVAVGTTFLLVTAGIYAAFMIGMYSALDLLGGLGWLRLAVAVVAAAFGLVHVKDYVAYRRGVSLSIPESRKPGLFRRMRAVASPQRALPAALAGTVLLAVGVSLLETPCTAGLPLLWTSLLAQAGVSASEAAALFGAYMAVFLLDEILVFVAAVVTLRVAKVQERHGRALKLVSGVVMLALAGTMLVAPQALESVVGTMVVFGGAASVVAVVLLAQERRSHSSTGTSSSPWASRWTHGTSSRLRALLVQSTWRSSATRWGRVRTTTSREPRSATRAQSRSSGSSTATSPSAEAPASRNAATESATARREDSTTSRRIRSRSSSPK